MTSACSSSGVSQGHEPPTSATLSVGLITRPYWPLRIHLSQTEQEEEENDLFDYINTNGGDHSGGDISDFFSDSIHNSHFPSPQRENRLENRVLARNALKQLIEECCAEADG